MAAADDQVLLASREPEAAFVVLAREVTGVEPAVGDPDAAVRLLVHIAREYVRPLDHQVADFVRGAVAQVATAVVEDHRLHRLIRDPQPDRADAAVAVARIHGTDAGRFGEAVAFEDLDAGRLFELADELRRHRRCAADRVTQRRHVGAGQWDAEQRRIDRRHGREETGAEALDVAPEVLDRCLRAKAIRAQQYDLGPDQERSEAGDHDTVDVKQWQTAEQRVLRAQSAHDPGRPGVRQLVEMRMARDLRQARGAAGVKAGGQIKSFDPAPAHQPVGGLAIEFGVERQHVVGDGPLLRRPAAPPAGSAPAGAPHRPSATGPRRARAPA